MENKRRMDRYVGGRIMKRRFSNEEELILMEPWASCERQLCACSKPDAPFFRYQCENGGGCKNFQRMDFGCWRLFVGKPPQKIADDNECCPNCKGH